MSGAFAASDRGLHIRLLAVLIGVGLLTGFALEADASKRKRVKGRVSISYADAKPTDRISGDVDSRKKECFRHRAVYLFIDGVSSFSDTTDRDGGYEMTAGSNFPDPETEYFVRARRKSVDNEGNPRPPIVCKIATSETIHSN